MAAARSNLESQVVTIMRSLRERGFLEKEALARRLEAGRGDGLEVMPRLRRITSPARQGKPERPISGRTPAGR